MDDEIFNKLLDKNVDNDDRLDSHMSSSVKASPELFYENGNQIKSNENDCEHFYDEKIREYELKLHELESHLNKTMDENKKMVGIRKDNKNLSDEVQSLNKRINEIESAHATNNLAKILESNVHVNELESALNEWRNKYLSMKTSYENVMEELNKNKIENG